jgi:hypothetical protein
MATQQSMDTVQKAYIGYYGRPADPAGLTYWADRLDEENGDLSALINEFGTSEEYTDRFDGMSNEDLVNNLYQQLFNRDAEQEGLDFYVAKLENEESSLAEIAVVIMDGAQNADAVALENKLQVAQDFTAAIEEEDVVYGEHQIDEAVELIESVDSSTDLSMINVDDIILNFPGEAEPNTLFTLTQNTETVVTDNEPAMQLVTYWGYNPHEHGETDVDNTDGYDPDGNDSNLTNETVSDGGVPLWQLIQTVQTITGLDFAELGLIDAESTTPDLSAVTNLTVDGGDNGSTSTIQVTLADGTLNTAEVELADEYVEYLHDILFDAEGNSRLFQKEVPLTEYTEILIDTNGDGIDDTTIVQETYVDPGTTSAIVTTPIVLTPNTNNGFTVEDGQTNDADNMIVAGRLDLLHGAYIDGGDGYNTLEVDAKGHFAQPQELLNIQAVAVQNLPNIYTQDDEGNTSQYPSVEGVAGGDADSILDLSRATELEVVTITEGAYDGIDAANSAAGVLTVNGVRGNATVVLEGDFTQEVNVHFSEGAENGTNLVLNLGLVSANLNILGNSDTLNIESIGGGNVVSEAFLDTASLMTLNVSGDARLQIAGSLEDQFAANTPATIDASANTAGVDLELSNHTDDIMFTGTAASDDQFIAGTTGAVVITGGDGSSEFTATADEDITITAGNGNNKIVADSDDSSTQDNESVVTVTVGNGDNDIDVDSDDHFVITAGDGANRIEADAVDTDSSVTDLDASTIVVGDGHNEIDAAAAILDITAGNGGNEIEATAASATITTGTGNDVISATGTGTADTATINAGEGNNTVTASGFETVAVTTGAGDDAVTIVGGNQNLDSTDGVAGELAGENSNETLINVDLGSGANTLTLGSDAAADNIAITAMPGSTITGENITLVIQSETDLSRADITGVTAVQLGNADELTLSLSQFIAMGGSTAFSVIGEEFAASSVLNIIVDQDTSLDDLNIDALPRSIDLSFEVMDSVTLEMTAQQLHERVTDAGVTTYTDNNTDFTVGTVHITDAGEDFDAYDVALTGSVNEAAAGLHLRLDATPDGYERPIAATSYTRLQINTDELTNGEQTPFDTHHTFLRITGDSDLIFTPVEEGIDEWGQEIANAGDSILLGDLNGDGTGTEDFKVDFSSVTGTVTGLTFENFENVDAIYGNGGARVDVKLEGNVATAAEGLVSKGVSTYVVTEIEDLANDDADADATTATFYTCETTKDLAVLGLQGNYDSTITFGNTERGVEFLMEVEYAKADGYVVGTLVGEFARADGGAVVDVVALDALPAGEVQKVAGIELTNAISAEINVTGGNTEIESFVSNDVETVVLTADAALTIDSVLDGTIESVDATGVVGDLALSIAPTADFAFEGNAGSTTLTLTGALDTDADVSFASAGELTLLIDGIDGGDAGNTAVTTDLSSADLSGVDAIVIGDDDSVTMTIAQTEAMGKANITGDGTLTLVGLGEEEFSLDGYDEDLTVGGVNLTVVDADGDGVVTLHANTDLTDVASLVIPKGVTLNLTAAQFQQLNGNGTITGETLNAFATVDYTINITDLMQADVEDGFVLTGINAATVNVTLAESVEISDNTSDLDLDAGANAGGNAANAEDTIDQSVTINVGDDMTFTHNDSSDLDQVAIVGGTNSTVRLTETTAGAAIDASGWDVDLLQVDEGYVSGGNIDNLFQGLLVRVVKQIFDQNGDVVAQDQTVTIEAGVTIGGALEINRVEDDVEIADLTLNLSGGVIINGELTLDSTDKNDGNDLLHAHMQSLTINSTGTVANDFSGTTANIIVGAIDGSGASAETQNNVLNITINAEQELDLQGGIVFTSAAGDDAFTLGDDTEAAAAVTVNGTADVNLGSVDTSDDDVDSLTVHNAGTGAVSVTVDVTNVDQDVAGDNVDALAFTGTNINLTVAADGADLDLSDDDLSGVATLSVGDTSTVSLSLAQFNTLTATNIVVVDGSDGNTTVEDTAGLDIVDYDGSAFDATTLDANFGTVTLSLVDGDVTLDPSVDLTDVSEIFVQEGRVLNLTAAQYQQLQGTGTITAVDTDGDAAIAGITVNITDLTQADIWVDADGDGEQDAGEGFDLSAITTGVDGKVVVTQSATEDTITLGSYDDEGLTTQTLDVDVSSDLNGAEYVLGDNQTLELVNSSQADGLDVTGGADSTVVFRFDTLDVGQIAGGVPGIDVSDYDITELHTLNTMYSAGGNDGDENVEVILENLASAVELVITSDPLALGLVSARMRMVTIEEGVTVASELVFNDIQQTVELTTLTIDFEGDASIGGDLRIPTVDEGIALEAANFGTLTINSNGTASNSITGDITAVSAGPNPTTTAEEENSLLNVVFNLDQDMVLGAYDDDGHASGGDIIFTALGDTAQTANLTLEGTADLTMHGVDTTDADTTESIGTLNIVNNAGTLTMTGGTAAISANNTETINISGTGDVAIGTNDLQTTGAPDASEAVDAATLSTLDASGLTGTLTLTELSDVDSIDFTFTAGTGVTTVELDDAAFGSTNNDEANAWTFDLSNAAAGSELTIGSTIVFADASGDAETTNSLSIDVGTNQVVIAANQDFTNLDSLSVTGTIVLQAGVDLILTAEQASSLTIIVDPAVITDVNDDDFVAGDVPTVTITELGESAYDFSNILTGVAAASNESVFTATLAADANNLADVEINAATDLGEVEIVLIDVADAASATDNNDLAGQTIRFNTEEQAARTIELSGAGVDGQPSTNVVWLFETITAAVDTSGYSSDIARVWFKDALVNGANVEELFTSLPDSILRVDFATLAELEDALTTVATSREVELVAFTNLPNGLEFSDENALQNVEDLTISMGGEVTIGDLELGNVINNTGTYANEADLVFDGLTIESWLADETGALLAPNLYDETENEAPDAGNTIGDISVGTDDNIDLLDVTLDTNTLQVAALDNTVTGAEITTGTITFDSETASATATLTTEGANDVTIASLDASDADISVLTIDHNSTGTLTAPGASPAINADNTEQVVITNEGDVVLGTDGDATKPGIDGGDELSVITVTSAAGKSVDLGIIQNVDSEDFTLDGDITNEFEERTVTIANADAGDEFTVTVNDIDFNYTLQAGEDSDDARDALITLINADATLDVTATNTGAGEITLTGDNAGEHYTLAVTKDTDTNGTATIAAADVAITDATVAVLDSTNTLSATGTWNLRDTSLTLDGVTLNAGGELTLHNIDLKVSDDVDLSILGDDLTLSGGTTLEVLAGQTLTLTADQADALTITGAGTVVITDGALTLAADLSGIMTAEGDSGTVTLAIDTADDADIDDSETDDVDTDAEDLTFTGVLGVADVTVSGGGSLTLDAAVVTTGADRDGDVATDNDLPSFTVESGATLNLDAQQANALAITGAGTTAITMDETTNAADAAADLSGVTTVTAADVTVTGNTDFTGDFGTVDIFVNDGFTLTAPYSELTGLDVNEQADSDPVGSGTGALEVVLTDTDDDADLGTINGSLDVANRTALVAATMTFTGDLDGVDVVITADRLDLLGGGVDVDADTVTLTIAASILSGSAVTGTDADGVGVGAGINDTLALVVTDLASDLDADLSGVDTTGDLDTATADFDTSGTFTGSLGDVTVTVADGVTMTAAASILEDALVKRSSEVGTGTVAVTLSSAVIADAGADLSDPFLDNTGNPAVIESITVLDSMTFGGTLPASPQAVEVADGATLTITAAIADTKIINQAGTTGAVAISNDATGISLVGSADVTVTLLDGNLDASDLTGDLTATFTDDSADGGDITLGGGTNTIDATAVAAGQTLLLSSAGIASEAEVTDVVFDNAYTAGDVINLIIEGEIYSHTVVTGGSGDVIAAAFHALINGIDANVTSTATGGASGELVLTAIVAGVEVAIAAEDATAGGNTTVTEDNAHEVAPGATTVTTEDGNIVATTVADGDGDTTTGGVTLNGGDSANTITGSANDDIIDGGIDDDALLGGAGDDTFVYDATLDLDAEGGETVDGEGGTDVISVETTAEIDLSKATISNVETLDLSNAATDVIITGVQLLGFSGAQGLVESSNDDDLVIDTLLDSTTYGATNANDTFVFDAANSDVTVTGFSNTADLLGLDIDNTTAGTAAAATAVVEDEAAAAANANAATYDLGAATGGDTNAIDLVTLDQSVLTNLANADLDAATDGTELLAALVVVGGANSASGITMNNVGDELYILTSDGTDSFLYHADSDADAEATAGEITLVATFENVDIDGLLAANTEMF